MNSQLSKIAAGGRLLIALLFLLSGLAKIADPAGTLAYITSAGLPLPYLSYAGAVAVEVVGGILLVLGYRTRIVALVVAAYSVAAAVGFHTDFADQNQMIHFLKNVAIAGGLVQIVSFGAGAFSLDARRGDIRRDSPLATTPAARSA